MLPVRNRPGATSALPENTETWAIGICIGPEQGTALAETAPLEGAAPLAHEARPRTKIATISGPRAQHGRCEALGAPWFGGIAYAVSPDMSYPRGSNGVGFETV